MSAPRSMVTAETRTAALKAVNLEMLALQEIIHHDYAAKLAAVNKELDLNQLSNHIALLDSERQVRLNFLIRCEELIKYNNIWATNARAQPGDFRLSMPSFPIYMFKGERFKRFRPTQEALQNEIELLTTTIKLTKKLISDPANIDSTLTSLTEHAARLDTHLSNESAAGKRNMMWSNVIYSVGIILACVIGVIGFMMPIILPMTFSIGVTLAIVFSSMFASTATIIGTSTLSNAIRPYTYSAKSNVEICKQANSFHTPKR